MLRTSLTDLLGRTVPVIGAPMAGVAGAELAAAITAGGGVGMVGIEPGASPQSASEHLAAAGPGCGAGLLAWSLDHDDRALFDAVVASRPALVSVSYGDWVPWLERLHAEGLLAATATGTLVAAREAADAGVDVLVVRGGEGGGHGRNEVATLPLLQEVLDTVDHPCVVAAGGVATGRGLAAVLAAGAAGAWVGTAFLASPEASTTDAARDAVLAAASTDTVYSRVYDVASAAGWPSEFGGRSLRNRFTDRWTDHERHGTRRHQGHRRRPLRRPDHSHLRGASHRSTPGPPPRSRHHNRPGYPSPGTAHALV